MSTSWEIDWKKAHEMIEQERIAACERGANLIAELSDMTRNRDELRLALDRAERKCNELRDRAWRAEGSLTIRRSLCRDIAVALGCEGLEGDESLQAGLAAIRALKQARDAAVMLCVNHMDCGECPVDSGNCFDNPMICKQELTAWAAKQGKDGKEGAR